MCTQTHTHTVCLHDALSLSLSASFYSLAWTFLFAAAGRTNQELKKFLGTVDASPGSLAMAGFRTSAQTEIKAKNDERLRKSLTPERPSPGGRKVSPACSPPADEDRTKPGGKPTAPRLRQPVTKQRTPERVVSSPRQKNGSIPSAAKHILPRQSPKRESGGAQSTQSTRTASHKATREASSIAVDAHVKRDGTVAGTVTKTTHKARESAEVTTGTTAFQGSKSPPLVQNPQPKTPTTTKQSTTPSTAKPPATPSGAKSRLPQPSSSRIPTPGSAGKSKPAGK